MARAASNEERREPMIRVLVVDDNIDAAETLAMLLKALGHDVVMAHDGTSALIRASESIPDLVLLDIGLPGIDGFEVARRLRAQGLVSTRLVALTGYGRTEDLERARNAGFDHHLVKPVSFDILKDIIADVRASGTPRPMSPPR